MLSLEDQIGRVADAAFAQTSPVEWSGSARTGDARPKRGEHRRRFVLAAAIVLGLVLIGGLVAVLGDGSMTPTTQPVEPVVVPDSTMPVAPPVAPTVAPPASTAPPTSDAVRPSVVVVPSTNAPLSFIVQRPLVAIEADGDAVMLDLGAVEPVLLFDGQDPDGASQLGDGPNLVSRISVAADGSLAYVGLCCAPVVGTILTAQPPDVASITDTPNFGFAPTLNPSATLFAAAGSDTITVTDTASGVGIALSSVDVNRWGTTVDLMWLDDNTVAVLNRFSNVWTLTIITTDGTMINAGPTRPFALIREFPGLQFAGTAIDNEIAMHDAGTARVLSGTIDDYGNINDTGRGSSLQIITLPGEARSAWYTDPEELIWIDNNQQLHVGDQIISGQYNWARR